MSSGLFKQNLNDIVPYSAGKPKEELERESGVKDIIKLASNENPFGPSKIAIETIKDTLSNLNLYPDGSGYLLKQSLSERLGVNPSEIVIGNGSNEIIEFIIRAFLIPGDEAIISDLTFSLYKIFISIGDGKSVIAPLKEGRNDLKRMQDLISHKTKIIFIANPNNPTGTIVTNSEVDKFTSGVPEDVLIVFDEAYYEFVTSTEYPDTISIQKNGYKNIITLRTFSKIYGLAGLRLGYGIADKQIAESLNKVRQPFNTNSLAQTGALAALNDKEHFQRSIDNNNKGKEYLYSEFEKIGITYIPTEANFIYFDIRRDGKEIFNLMLKEGVIIRHIEGTNLRVSIGLPAENQRFINSLRKVLGK